MIVKAVERVGDKLSIIDQTRLPGELVYRELGDYQEIIEAIKRLEVRGAPAIGITAAYALPIAALQTGYNTYQQLAPIAADIKAARPTAVNLAWAVDRVMTRLKAESPADSDSVIRLLWAEAEAIHVEDRRMCARIGEHGAGLINDGDTILTHCNTGALATGGIGTALGVVYTCRDQGKKISVFVDETRPLLQGARLTAWELMREGIEATLICDSMAAVLMAQGKVQHVIVGADRVARNGDTANKIGTYGLAVQAKAHGVPFYVAAPASTFDDRIASGREIPIEERGGVEITEGFGRRTAPDGVRTFSPAFDVTPVELITFFIIDTGLRRGGRSN
jgi:methylthioribose-1-phosphate isomerase